MKAVNRVYGARELLWNLTLRELRTKYRRSILGWTWSMLNPLANLAIYGFVFGVIFDPEVPIGAPSGLNSFAFFLLCGLVPWNFFALMTGLGIDSVNANAGLVRRVAFPREVLVFSNILHAAFQFAIELSLLCVVLLIAGSPILPWLPFTILTGFLLMMFGAGIALALSALAVYFRDMTYLWTIAIQVWFFATPIVYAPSYLDGQVPSWVQFILEKVNPMSGYVRVFRRLLYDGTGPGAITWLGLVATSVVSLALGWIIFLKLEPRFAEEV